MNVPLVRDRMATPAITRPTDAPLADVAAVLESRDISAVPIVQGQALVGILSTTDLVAAVARGSGGAVARDVMRAPVVTASPDDSLDEAARRLVAARVHRLVVVEDERVVGILSARDVLEEVKARKVMDPIGALMTTPVESIEIGDTVDDAIEALARANVHGLVVVDGMAPVGVFTHAEALAAARLPPALRAVPVEDVMSYETVCLDVATPIYRAAAYAASMNVRRILVVEHRRLAGIISTVDLVGVLSRAEA
jgi:CBS domain-containing protein